MNSAEVKPGDVFVAIRGAAADGHDFVDEAVARGAAALLVERQVDAGEVPTVRVDDSRRALAELASEWYGRPADGLKLVGITGTFGKTSVLALLEAILLEAGRAVGTIGSLGVAKSGGAQKATGHTAPGPLQLHEALAEIHESGADWAGMEVTSHALVQQRVHGTRFDLGIFTNLVPFEHREFHANFRDYVEAKSRFFEHLKKEAPLVYSSDDRAVRRLVREREVTGIGCGRGPRTADVRVEEVVVEPQGSCFMLRSRKPLNGVDHEVEPFELEVRMRLLGRANLQNAALAAVAAMCMGVEHGHIGLALARAQPPRRRLELLHQGDFLVIDDTTGHPDSISALFEVVQRLEPQRVHAAFAIRGRRGPQINRRLADALAIWAERRPIETLVITSSEDAADERNRVTEEERQAFLSALRKRKIPYLEAATLDEAVPRVLEAAGEQDLVLLLGAQGMDGGAARVRQWMKRASGRAA